MADQKLTNSQMEERILYLESINNQLAENLVALGTNIEAYNAAGDELNDIDDQLNDIERYSRIYKNVKNEFDENRIKRAKFRSLLTGLTIGFSVGLGVGSLITLFCYR
jgi:hypothetical protein